MSARCPNCCCLISEKGERQLLDDLEEARIVLRNYRRGFWGAALITIISVAIFIMGNEVGAWGAVHHVDTGGEAGTLILLGLIGTVAGICCSVFWFMWHNTTESGYDWRKNDLTPAASLRAAERAHRNYIMEQA